MSDLRPLSPLHATQVRAYALLAATRLTPPNSRPSPADLAVWRNHVLDMADQYADYINHGRKATETTEAPE